MKRLQNSFRIEFYLYGMKKTMLMAAGLMFSLAASAQKLKESEVPAAVKKVFKKNYATATEVKWEKEGSNFEVEFEIGETEQSVVYDVSGNLIETEMEIKTEELPTLVKDYISENYKNSTIKEATRITDAKGIVTYEAEVKDKDLIFDANGNFIREEKDSHKN